MTPHSHHDMAPCLSPSDRVLRWISVLSLVPALAFMIPYGRFSHQAGITVLVMIPLGFSSLTGLFHLSKQVDVKSVTIFLDLFMASALLGTLIPACIFLSDSWGWRDMVILGSYGTMLMMVNFCIHVWIALRELGIYEGIRFHLSNMSISPTCPHCQKDLLFRQNRSPGSPRTPGGYAPVTLHDNEAEGRPSMSKDPVPEVAEYRDARPSNDESEYRDARPSTDDETANLV